MFKCPRWTKELYVCDKRNKIIISKKKWASFSSVWAQMDEIRRTGSARGKGEIWATVRNITSIWLAAVALLGSQVNVSPECLVYVFLMDKKQIIAIKEDELVQLLFSCFFFVFFWLFPSSLISLACPHTSAAFCLALIFPEACMTKRRQVWSVEIVSCRWLRFAFCKREDPGQLWSGWGLIWVRSDLRLTGGVWLTERCVSLSGRDEKHERDDEKSNLTSASD